MRARLLALSGQFLSAGISFGRSIVLNFSDSNETKQSSGTS